MSLVSCGFDGNCAGTGGLRPAMACARLQHLPLRTGSPLVSYIGFDAVLTWICEWWSCYTLGPVSSGEPLVNVCDGALKATLSAG